MVQSDDKDGVGRVPSPGDCAPPHNVGDNVSRNAGSGDPAYNDTPDDVGRVPTRGGAPLGGARPDEPPPRRLRRLHRVWPDREGNISYLLTVCVDGRARVLDNEATFQRMSGFLLDSPARYRWFARRFVVMPDHLHVIAHQGYEAARLGEWIKALKAVVGGLERRPDVGRRVGEPGLQGGGVMGRPGDERPVGAPGLQHDGPVGRVPAPGVKPGHEFTCSKRAWHWQEGFHDHKLRTPESEQRKWEYVCLNPVRYGLVARPEQWPFGGEILHDPAEGPRLIRGTPPLLEIGLLIEEEPGTGQTPGGGTRPT
jgi:hypothetical protein